jgi:lysophospholipase L1-like esterase
MWNRAIIAAAAAVIAAVSLVTSGITNAAPAAPLYMVVLGDSTAQPSECPECTDYAHLYAREIEKATRRHVEVDNRGTPQQGSMHMLQTSQALANVYADHGLRRAIAGADVVVIGLGFNDTAWGRLDDPCEAAPEFPVVDWDQVTDECQQRVTHENKQALDILLTQVNQLRAGRPTLLRVVTPYDAVLGDAVDPGWDTPETAAVARRGNGLLAAAECELAGFHGGACADVYHALNGADGRTSAQPFLVNSTHLNQAGHREVASLLAGLGYAPLAP